MELPLAASTVAILISDDWTSVSSELAELADRSLEFLHASKNGAGGEMTSPAEGPGDDDVLHRLRTDLDSCFPDEARAALTWQVWHLMRHDHDAFARIVALLSQAHTTISVVSPNFLTVCRRAVEALRALSKTRGAHAYLPELVAALEDLREELIDAHQYSEALDAAQETVAALRAVSADLRTATSSVTKARALTRLGGIQMASQNYVDAIGSLGECLDICRLLVEDDPGLYSGLLASSLVHSATVLRACGDEQSAFGHVEEAMHIYAALAVESPELYLMRFASTVNLSISLMGGEISDGLQSQQQGIALMSSAAEDNPETYLGELLLQLAHAARSLATSDRGREALIIARVELDLLAAGRVPVSDFMSTIEFESLGALFSTLGQHDLALAAMRRSVEVSRSLAQADPRTNSLQFEIALGQLGRELTGRGEYEEALTLAEERVAVSRNRADLDPRDLPGLAEALRYAAVALDRSDRHKESLALLDEAVGVYERALDDIELHAEMASFVDELVTLSILLVGMSECLTAVGRDSEVPAVWMKAGISLPTEAARTLSVFRAGWEWINMKSSDESRAYLHKHPELLDEGNRGALKRLWPWVANDRAARLDEVLTVARELGIEAAYGRGDVRPRRWFRKS